MDRGKHWITEHFAPYNESFLTLKMVRYFVELSSDIVELFGSPNRYYFPVLHSVTLSTWRVGAELLLVVFAA